jgi:hypothetical protein
MVIHELDVVHNWSTKVAQKWVDEKSSSFVTQRNLLSFISHNKAFWAVNP